jgi:5-methylcytosine-specific restriction protein A
MRREFSKQIKLRAWERANGKCEECTAILRPGYFDYDHIVPDAMGGEPTLDNCSVLCRACHDNKTRKSDTPAIAKSNRTRNRHLGIARKPTKFRGWRKMDGTVVYANDRRK